jgi:hypothetical protein
MPSNDAMTNNQDALVTAAWALAERLSGAEAYLVDRVGLKMTLDRDQEELLVADLGAAARTIITLSEREARKDAALNEAFDLLGGLDDAADVRAILLAALPPIGREEMTEQMPTEAMKAAKQELDPDDEIFIREYEELLDSVPYRNAQSVSIPTTNLHRLITIIREAQWCYSAARPIPASEVGEVEMLNDIAVMMSEFVDNWPQPKRVDTALKLIAKTLRAALDPPKHMFWGAGEPDCPHEIRAGNGELHTLRCKVCGEDNPRDDRCLATLNPPAEQGEG